MKQRKQLKRRTPLRRSWMKRRAPKRLKRRAAASPWLVWVRQFPCISCGSNKRSDAAHMPIGPHGVGLKSPDTNTVPLCRSCHRWFDGHSYPVLPRKERRELAERWLAAVRLMATPDNIESALELQDAGLGIAVLDDQGGLKEWRPGRAA